MLPFRKTSCSGRKKGFVNHEQYLSRIKKSLYYVNLPRRYCTSLPCTELAAEIFSEINKFSFNQLDLEEAATLSHNACISPCSLVLALLYVDRLKATNPKYLSKVSPSELFLISLMVGSKFLQDDGEEDEVNNSEWASFAGVTVKDVNRAEKQFLDAINWEVFVSEDEFWDRFRALEYRLGLRQGLRRGWFTYTEIDLLLDSIDLAYILQALCTITTACLTSYAASMLTLVGSAFLVDQIPGLGLKPRILGIENIQNFYNVSSFENIGNCLTNFGRTEDCTLTLPVRIKDMEIESMANYNNCRHELNNARGSDCINSDSAHLFLKILPAKSMNEECNLDENRDFRLFHSCDTDWRLSRIIRNYLLMNSVPNKLLSIADL